ncbi:MAG: terminase family protein [Betaproteobacteria bacterium]|nr:terminase family protein [Betaproteobacteria bacterium]
MPDSTLSDPTLDARRRAALLYWQGWSVAMIADELKTNPNTVYSWRRRARWDAAAPVERIEKTVENQYLQLVAKPHKSGADYKEIDFLGRQIERFARVGKYSVTGREGDLNPNIARRNEAPKRRRGQFDVADAAEKVEAAFLDSIFAYQRVWYEAGLAHRIRNVLKSRQIGATWFFAREALVDALKTGRNQIFLSASRAQAHVLKQYIVDFFKDVTGMTLRGDVIKLPNDAQLYFLGTSSRTAQSYHGNLYFDEYFWVGRFLELRKVASGMAMHKQWRQTYFSTPSSVDHEAYQFWSGQLFNRGRAKRDHVKLDLSHAALAGGRVCEDGQWRQIVTVEDALDGGCDLFDLEQLRLEYSEEEFSNLLLCEFMDASQSAFPFGALQRCLVDSWEEWRDLRPFAERPLADTPVWVGFDVALTGDNSALAVVAPPAAPGGAFRLVERLQFSGAQYQAQADAIRETCRRFNVQDISIDTTGGYGEAVFQLVKPWFPLARGIRYDLNSKVRLVLKAQSVINAGRLKMDAKEREVVVAFMAIKRVLTPSGQYVTFRAGRSEETSHADIAWAIMHALSGEPMEAEAGEVRTTRVEFFE